eukprot:scaffold155351_cov19-Prasinocladus_malaysianus.AAC.1
MSAFQCRCSYISIYTQANSNSACLTWPVGQCHKAAHSTKACKQWSQNVHFSSDELSALPKVLEHDDHAADVVAAPLGRVGVRRTACLAQLLANHIRVFAGQNPPPNKVDHLHHNPTSMQQLN